MVECWLFSINVSIWSQPTSTGLPNCGTSSSEKSPIQNFANYFWHIWSLTAPSPYTAEIFFVCFSCVFTFLKIIKHNTPKMLRYLLPSSILKWLHKNSTILISFFFKILFLEREGGRSRKTSMCGHLLHAPHQGPGPQPRHVPWLGIELETLCFAARPQSTELFQPGAISSLWSYPIHLCSYKIPYDLTYKWNLINKTNKQSKYNQRHWY